MIYAIGSLVKARNREWVVLPVSDEKMLILRPLGGTEDEIAGVHTDLEKVVPARFDLPDPSRVGDYRSARLLRDAVRLGFRSSAGPFRSFGRLAFEPRPYQLVPLLMALKLDPVRILIADDVGVGKTIEAGLIARELLDRGEVDRLAVLCPPSLAEQWQNELKEKFNIDAVLVLPGTVRRLERDTSIGQSLFEIFPFVIVSMDFIKSDRRRHEFLRTCPDLVIVDEAHTCAYGVPGRRTRHQRYELISAISEKENRHLILVTATPHSGKEEAFRSLLSFIDRDFANLPQELAGPENVHHRRRLAAHFVQRRRADIRHFMEESTPFPDRYSSEETYKLSSEYKKLFDRVLEYARETVRDVSGKDYRKRVLWWSALALLRSLASSPAAAAATLRSRSAVMDAETPEDIEEIGRRSVFDLVYDESTEEIDVTPGGDSSELAEDVQRTRRRLLEMARTAESLKGDKDNKLVRAASLVQDILNDGFNPILFCRFISTAEYVAEKLRKYIRGDVEIAAVTGTLVPEEREERVKKLGKAKQRVLVCTDCLSEGINLQQYFDAVMHYDLSWNPTRHEQREGRVDRFGQNNKVVRTITYYGIDNRIDGIVLDVLLRKHQSIKSSLGISVPVPGDVDQVVEAIFEGLLLWEARPADQFLPGMEEFIKPKKEQLYFAWEAASECEKRSRTMFAQERIKPEEVAHELNMAREALGSGIDVKRFFRESITAYGGIAVETNSSLKVDISETPRALQEALGEPLFFEAGFELPVSDGETYLTRTHPRVEALAAYVMDTALDPLSNGVARRCGAIRTKSVKRRTTLLLLRLRYHIINNINGSKVPLLAEDLKLVGYVGPPDSPNWLDSKTCKNLLRAEPDENISHEQAEEFIRNIIRSVDVLRPMLEKFTIERGEKILEAHRRVRRSARMSGFRTSIEPSLPPDILGIYLFLPVPAKV
ncbi:MAG: DEAD/DEAH box helicase [Deltaproteobacteria bacterium]|nr:DEAD/DEAH box helicase [Deltaproteobacteria bacterium]